MAIFEKEMSEEEANELKSSGLKKLEDAELEEVDGGYICANVSKQYFEVIDDKTGNVLSSGFPDPLSAMSAAARWGQSTEAISPSYLEELRQKNNN